MKQNTLNPGFLDFYIGGPLVHIGRKKNYGSPATFIPAGLQVLLAEGTSKIASHRIAMPFGG